MQFPIGGIVREPLLAEPFETTVPTVKVWKEEDIMKKIQINPFCRALMLCIPLLFHTSGKSFSQQANPTIASSQSDSLEIYLREITVSASFVNEKSSPLRLKTISHKDIERKAIGATYPELIRDIPGIYATSESGSYGDAKINIRGFKQENISVLLTEYPFQV